MGAAREWFAGFDLGEFLGLEWTTAQIGHLAGALFLALFGLSALRRVTQAPGMIPAVWIAVALDLLAGSVLVAARGFPDQVPVELRPWTVPDRLLRAAVVLGLLGCAVTFMSAHWVRRPSGRMVFRLLGMLLLGMAVWLSAGWFADELPEEARVWAARPIVTRALTVLGLLGTATLFWLGDAGEGPHRRWARRALAVPTAGLAVALAARWFGPTVLPAVDAAEAARIIAVATLVATGTCVLVAVGAWFLRRSPPTQPVRASATDQPLPQLPLVTDRPLPVAVLLDDQGHPVLPARSSGSGTAGP